MTTDEKLERLPKWARREIERLGREVEHWRQQATVGPEGSNTYVDRYPDENRTPLGDSPTIAFEYGEGWGKRFQARLEGEELVVSGGDGILVRPRSSNVVHMRIGR